MVKKFSRSANSGQAFAGLSLLADASRRRLHRSALHLPAPRLYFSAGMTHFSLKHFAGFAHG